MSLPPIFLFETHHNPIARQLLTELLPDLKKLGYKIVGLELPEDFATADKIRSYVTSCIKYGEEAQQIVKRNIQGENLDGISILNLYTKLSGVIKDSHERLMALCKRFFKLESEKEMLKLVQSAERLEFTVQGLDSVDQSSDQIREQAMLKHLTNLKERGVVYLCGCVHSDSLVQNCKGSLYYFPRSAELLAKENKEFKELGYHMSDLLRKSIQVLSKDEISGFAAQIQREIVNRITENLKERSEGNIQSRHLQKVFNVAFKVFVCPEFFAYAVCERETTPNIADIEVKLNAAKVEFRTILLNGKEHLVIPNINVKEVAQKILSLKNTQDDSKVGR